ncbi:MAG: DegV family protein [Clostridia bacterium]|nr:DegV family protein [Clostridia bacterium]
MKIAVSTETTVDLTKELIEKYQIKILPFSILLGDKNYYDGEITCEKIIDFVNKTKILPKTGAVNKVQYDEHFDSLLKDYDAIIHISLSSELSSAYSNAVLSAKERKNVFVIDSRSLSTGIALLVIYAKELVDSGEKPSKIVELVSKRVSSVQASFVLKRVDYLYKGGRCNVLSYIGANLLKICPQILVTNGKMTSGKKYRGSYKRVVENYCKDVLETFDSPDLSHAFLTYTTADDKTLEVAKSCLEKVGFNNIHVTRAGGTITSHCGEDCLGILFMNDGNA